MGKQKQIVWILIAALLLGTIGILNTQEVQAAGTGFTDAQQIEVNTSVYDNISSRDEQDYFTFTLLSPGRVSLSFIHDEGESTNTYWNIALYDSDRTKYLSFTSRRNIVSTDSVNIGLPAGTYYVLVEGVRWSDIYYQLLVNYSAADNWEEEFNDGFLSANDLAVNETVNGSICTRDDSDYYKFVLDQGGKVSLSFVHDEGESTNTYWNIALYDSDRAEYLSFTSRRNIVSTDSANIGLPAGTYYVLVEGIRWSSTDYQLTVNYTKSYQWEAEPNGGFTYPNNLEIGETKYGTIKTSSDPDYYKIILPYSGYYSLSLKHKKMESTSTYWRMYLYNADRTSLGDISSTGNVATSRGWIYLNAGTYYVLVESGNSWSSEDYKVKMSYYVPQSLFSTVKSPAKGKLTVKWYQTDTADGYEIVTATDAKFKKNKKVAIVVGGSKLGKSITGLKRGKAYYVKVRAYRVIDGKKYYGAYSAKKKVTIK